jgi:Ala-tRNA(Pro) deacylase
MAIRAYVLVDHWITIERSTAMITPKLKDFLTKNSVRYEIIRHAETFTAQETAHVTHVSGRQVAKTVIVKIDGDMAMAVLPANQKVILQDLRDITGADDVQFATEDEFVDLFPGCEPGAMPPFGNLYGMEVFVSPTLAQQRDILFNAGNHHEVMKIAYKDFERLVEPQVLSFTT